MFLLQVQVCQKYQITSTLTQTDNVGGVAITSDNLKIVSGMHTKVQIWNIEDESLIDTMTGHSWPVTFVAISNDNTQIASRGSDSWLRIWNFNDGSLIRYQTNVSSFAFSWDSSKIITGVSNYSIQIRNLEDGSIINTLTGHTSFVVSIAISSDNSKIVSGSSDNTLKIWGMGDGSLIKTLTGHTSSVGTVAVSSDNKKIVSGSADATIKIWNLEDGSLVKTINESTNSIVISSDNLIFFSAGYQTIKIWSLNDGSLIDTLTGHTENVRQIAISTDNKKIISGGNDKSIKIWDFDSGNCITYDSKLICEQCENYFFVDDGKCSQIDIENCIKSSDGQDCEVCEASYYINEGKCSYIDIEHCIKTSDGQVCQECKAFYQVDQGKCSFIKNCSLSSDGQGCEKCDDSYYLEDSLCIFVQNCSIFNSEGLECQECKAFYHLDNNKCSSIKNCNKFSSNEQECQECKAFYYLDKGLCSQIENCSKSSDGQDCEKCNAFYKLDEGLCIFDHQLLWTVLLSIISFFVFIVYQIQKRKSDQLDDKIQFHTILKLIWFPFVDICSDVMFTLMTLDIGSTLFFISSFFLLVPTVIVYLAFIFDKKSLFRRTLSSFVNNNRKAIKDWKTAKRDEVDADSFLINIAKTIFYYLILPILTFLGCVLIIPGFLIFAFFYQNMKLSVLQLDVSGKNELNEIYRKINISILLESIVENGSQILLVNIYFQENNIQSSMAWFSMAISIFSMLYYLLDFGLTWKKVGFKNLLNVPHIAIKGPLYKQKYIEDNKYFVASYKVGQEADPNPQQISKKNST